MSLEGMDIDQARSLAQRLDANARALTVIATMLAGLASELGHYWQGPASAAFQHQWAAEYRGALAGAASTLEELHAHLIANLEQQVRASAADSGSGGPAGIAGGFAGLSLTAILGGIGRAWRIAGEAEGYGSLVLTPLERLEQLDDKSMLLRFRDSEVLRWLHDSPGVQRVDELMTNTHVTKVLDKVDDVGTGMTILSIGVAGGQAGYDLAHHQYASAGGEIIDGTAAGLKGSGDPVLYLAGFDVSLLQKDYELGRQIQWSGIPSPFSLSNFENDYIPAFKSLPGQLVSTLAEII